MSTKRYRINNMPPPSEDHANHISHILKAIRDSPTHTQDVKAYCEQMNITYVDGNHIEITEAEHDAIMLLLKIKFPNYRIEEVEYETFTEKNEEIIELAEALLESKKSP